MHHILFWQQTYLPVIFLLGCRDYLYFLVTVLVISVSTVLSKFTLFACSVKMDLSLLNNFPLSTGMMLSISVEGTGRGKSFASQLLYSSLVGSYNAGCFSAAGSCNVYLPGAFLHSPDPQNIFQAVLQQSVSGKTPPCEQLSQAPSRTNFWQVPEGCFQASPTSMASLPCSEPSLCPIQ